MKKFLSLLVFMVLLVGCSGSSGGFELDVIVNHWNQKDEAFGGYNLKIGEFNADDVTRIGDKGSTLLSLTLNSDDTVRNYSTLVRDGYAEGNIEELALI